MGEVEKKPTLFLIPLKYHLEASYDQNQTIKSLSHFISSIAFKNFNSCGNDLSRPSDKERLFTSILNINIDSSTI